jgi:hypothetical protein
MTIIKFVRLIAPEPCHACRSISTDPWAVEYTEEHRDDKGGTQWTTPTHIEGLSKLAAEMLFCKAILDGASVRIVRKYPQGEV